MGVDMERFEKTTLTISILTLSLLLILPAFAQNDRGIKIQSNRFALVIGNGAYNSAPLKNTINDAEDMTKNLRQLGFKVILQKNVDQRKMEDAIRYFGKQLRDGGVGLFYFAGHGMQVNGRNYLIPIDARIESESDIKYEAVDAGRVLGKMEDAGNQLNIVILDACRNNPFARSFRMEQKGLARMDAPTGSLIAYSTAPGEVAADGTEKNGIFTKHLIRHMKTPNLPIEQVLKRVRIDVANETNERQIPWESSSLMGDFYFKAEKSIASFEKKYKPEAPPKSSSDTQVASISDDNQRKIEPWTGTWNVEGFWMFNGQWVMKQRDKEVVFTFGVFKVFKGVAEGNQLKGNIHLPGYDNMPFEIYISSDSQTFEGKTTLKDNRSFPLKGKRQIPTKSSSETQVASISDDNLRKIEPWTGVWIVEGINNNEWKMEQNGNIIKGSTQFYEISGKVSGSQLKGRLFDMNKLHRFVINISQDQQSFEGVLHSQHSSQTILINAKKRE